MPPGAGIRIGAATVAAAGVAGQTVAAGATAATALCPPAAGLAPIRRPRENTNKIAAMRTRLRQAGVCQRWTVDIVSLRDWAQPSARMSKPAIAEYALVSWRAPSLAGYA